MEGLAEWQMARVALRRGCRPSGAGLSRGGGASAEGLVTDAGERTRASRSTPCCASSIRRSRAGAPTSAPACPARPSATSAITRGSSRSGGCAENTAGPPGRTFDAATATTDGGLPRNERALFNPAKVSTTRYRYWHHRQSRTPGPAAAGTARPRHRASRNTDQDPGRPDRLRLRPRHRADPQSQTSALIICAL
jgi:hypothetical protein